MKQWMDARLVDLKKELKGDTNQLTLLFNSNRDDAKALVEQARRTYDDKLEEVHKRIFIEVASSSKLSCDTQILFDNMARSFESKHKEFETRLRDEEDERRKNFLGLDEAFANEKLQREVDESAIINLITQIDDLIR